MPPKAASKGAKKAASKAKGPAYWGQETQEEEEGELQHLHLQGVETGSPRHWYLCQGHVYHELLRE